MSYGLLFHGSAPKRSIITDISAVALELVLTALKVP